MHAARTGLLLATASLCFAIGSQAQQKMVTLVKETSANKINILVDNQPFTSFFYPDTLEKPVLNPIYAANGTVVTRGYPLNPQPGDPTDHPHHIGTWMNFENVNGLDFWNNSFAIPADKKKNYGWIKTKPDVTTKDGMPGTLTYHANWTNQQNEVLLEETTQFTFSGTDRTRIIDRQTTLKGVAPLVTFTDAKDGFLGIRLAHALEIPAKVDKKFTDDKGIVTIVKSNSDSIAS
ncbi:MAG TPA: DUF6807 family protein, partial [Chitinophagaceae bacterium]|nr:DUF6807 family protein [Chitinophagaceae bacterium]